VIEAHQGRGNGDDAEGRAAGARMIAPDTLTPHADRGASMRSKPAAALPVDLDITDRP